MAERYMLRALELSKKALPNCIPNPPVGCVLVKHHKVVSEGFTQAIGGHHAEVQALNAFSGSMLGVTAYVTLEPCSFVGRTPACANTLVNSGIKHVVISLLDPDPRNNGRGIEILEQAGIHVEIGLCSDKVNGFLAPYLSKCNK
jgi:pyrimidine deaminase RibD-like protein